MGSSIDAPSLSEMRRLLASLDDADDEHPDVSLTHESEWSISVFAVGLIVFQNLEEVGSQPMHMRASRERACELWELLSQGRIEELKALSWLPGYGA